MKIKFAKESMLEAVLDINVTAQDTVYAKDMVAFKESLSKGVFTKEFDPNNLVETLKGIINKIRFDVRDNFSGVKKKGKIKVGVHDGIMHADDVLSCALVNLWVDKMFDEYCDDDEEGFDIMRNYRVKFVRSRISKKLDKCDIVLDVGGSDFVDPDEGRIQFDHHQDNLAYPSELVDAEAYPNGVQFAACGKIYDLLFGVNNSPAFNEYVYQNLLHPIEAQDNGCKMTMSARQNLLAFIKEVGNPASVEPEDMDLVFEQLVFTTMPIVSSVFENAATASENETLFTEAVEANESGDPQILILNHSFAWKNLLYKKADKYPQLNDTLFVVFPHFEGDRWNVQAVNTSPTGFELRKALPEEWRGKNNEDLANASGIQGAIFCHKNGFIGAWQTKEQAIEAAISALG